jgi:hypothetical protein
LYDLHNYFIYIVINVCMYVHMYGIRHNFLALIHNWMYKSFYKFMPE